MVPPLASRLRRAGSSVPTLDRAFARRWLRGYLLVALLVLLLGVVAGFALGTQLPGLPMGDGSGSNPFFPDKLTFVNIAVNNLIAMVVMLLGAVSLGLTTAFVLLVNGVVIGLVVSLALREVSATTIVMLIAPHGVLEIPAILTVAAVGFRFGHRTVRYIRGREEDLITDRELHEAGFLLAVSAVLIVVAAWIEANVTLRLAEQVATAS